MIDEAEIRRHYELLRPSLNERGRCLFAASQVRVPVTVGLSRCTARRALPRPTGARDCPQYHGWGLKVLAPSPAVDQRVRRSRVGKKRSATDATFAEDLLRLVEPATLGDPMTLLF